jgi:hypothetical protein
LNALKRVEQIDMVIAELDGSAPESAGWCKDHLLQYVIVGDPNAADLIIHEKHCIVGAVQKHVPAPRTRFCKMMALDLPLKYYFRIKKCTFSATDALIAFNDEQDAVGPVLKLLRDARAQQAKIAGLVE